MSVFRISKDKDNPFVMINKTSLSDPNLSWRAKGLLSYLLSLPDDWKIYENEITRHAKDGRDATRATIKELETHGYIKRERTRDEKGRLKSVEYTVYEVSTYDWKSNIGEPNIGQDNTTNNNGKPKNKKKDMYMSLATHGHPFLKIYNWHFQRKFGKDHMKLSEDNLHIVLRIMEELILFDVTEDKFQDTVIEHFSNLPDSNNGNILAFLKAAKRYLDVDTTEFFKEK